MNTIKRIFSFIKASGVFLGAIVGVLASSQDEGESKERRLHDSDLSGELNHRTGRLDAGNDPYGWYDED